ncbi:MAG: YafY family transcriptional regulator [Chloroflexi bacterium AL-W]|nr:YafY family transcriptional regulator [Chloroflexi bacterium AL-N1]NOK65838.1 YafY family transcriptional regulator [Chloroflexi bacterium AL-N10]NOK74221.1 YafY family transcriptional regulator [Chloroflexi bacterium AL-N5]NOK80871.1 YafY family transcriptional regulator [Chloroflexi bacterium AL-W]NOK88479.1 YafY family transcriptional regulator [Chloroflexi bacterium AL-N15]
MYHPTTRLLTILELLQTHPLLSGAELARRLEVEPRSVRRYIQMLQDMGMPIEASYGPGGGYRLRPGFKLPPLMFSEEEATAIALGLLGTAWLEIGMSSVAIERALAKVARVLPERARARINAVTSHLMLSPHAQESQPDATLLIELSDAIQQQQRINLTYRSHRDEVTQRIVEPYGVAGWWGQWYMVGYCCLRKDYRLFRLDRLQQMQIRTDTFVRDKTFDCEAYINRQLKRQANWQVVVEFQTTLYTVQQKIPEAYGSLTDTPTGVLFQCDTDDIDYIARYLMALNLPFVIHNPPALREALLRLAEQITQIATAPHND